MSNYTKQLSNEFGISETHVEVILNEVFKLVSNTIREGSLKTIRLLNFGIFHPKIKFKNELKDNIPSTKDEDITISS